ncbi:MAG: penicillin-binding transpeptidase domain-containing protein [Roseburia sp.]|nr:penicillin-binding transpeptidase domain-containing protein [Roseburia sp.]
MSVQLKKTVHRKKITVTFFILTFMFLFLFGRLVYLMVWKAEHYANLATKLHERERSIKAARGRILDRNGTVLADNKTVCTISVIYNQVKDREQVIDMLCRELKLEEEYVRKRVEKYSSMERIKSNVDKETGDRIREYDMPGVKVDEDYKRYYPYGELASKVLGFTGGDNQGIIGLEVKYEEYLEGEPGMILTVTDAKGIEVDTEGERRIEPVAGNDLYISLDRNIQTYATQLAQQARATKQADSVSIIVMNPQNGELYAMVNVPEFDLNNPYEISPELLAASGEKKEQDILNGIWRNGCINDTYEPGSTFKIITAAAGLEEGVVTPESTFSCPGFIVVDDRKIRCHKVGGHGSEDFVHATMNSCNPVFITVGMRLGVEKYYGYFERFGLKKKTGVDLPGEAGTIMHKMEDMGNVELATVSFGQSFQITPLQLLTTASSIINGGRRITPHFGVKTVNVGTGEELCFSYPVEENIVSEETSAIMREILEMVVSEGGGKNGSIEGYRIGGKTATSQTLPRGSGRYISSFLGFAPADDPQIIAIAIINNPQGVYYGGQIAAPIIRQLFENVLPYLGIMEYNQ